MAITFRRPCRCGHQKDAHEHYRSGTDCSACSCARFAGQLEVTVRFGRTVPGVVVPDAIPSAPGPYVRPTHMAGLPDRGSAALSTDGLRSALPLQLPSREDPPIPSKSA